MLAPSQVATLLVALFMPRLTRATVVLCVAGILRNEAAGLKRAHPAMIGSLATFIAAEALSVAMGTDRSLHLVQAGLAAACWPAVPRLLVCKRRAGLAAVAIVGLLAARMQELVIAAILVLCYFGRSSTDDALAMATLWPCYLMSELAVDQFFDRTALQSITFYVALCAQIKVALHGDRLSTAESSAAPRSPAPSRPG